MAEKIIIAELDIDMAEVIKDQIDLKAKIDDAKKAVKEAKDTQGELSAEYITASANLKSLQSDLKTNENIVNKVTAANNSQLGTIQKLEAQNSALRAEQKKLNLASEEGLARNKQITAQINTNTEAIKQNSDKQKQGWMTVGQYSDALKQMPFGGFISGMQGMITASKAFIATPLGMVLGLIAAAVTAVISVFKTFQPIVDKLEQGLAALSAAFTWVKESVIGLFTGQKEHNESMKDAVKAAIALKKAEQDLDDMNLKLIESDAKHKRQIDELLLQSKDRTKSEKERVALIDQALEIEKKAYAERKSIADKEYEIALGKITTGRNLSKEQIQQLREQGVQAALNLQETKGISDEEVKAFAEASAKREQVLNESVAIREKAINRQNALIEKAEEEEAKREEAAAKRREKAEEDKKKKADAEQKRKEKEAEEARKKAEEAVALMDYELQKWNVANKSKLDGAEQLSKELIASEETRLNNQFVKEQEILKAQLDNKLISQTEYNSQILALEDEKNMAISDLNYQFDQEQKAKKLEAAQIDFENQQALFEENALAQLDAQKALNDKMRAEELAAADKVGADKNLINQKYNKADLVLEKAKTKAKLSLAQDFASNIATIAGENTAVGKAAAVAAATINTYQAATGAYAALAPIPIVGPALGIAAAAAAVASGISQVKKILSVSPGSTPSAGGETAAASSSGGAAVSTLQSVNTSLGQGIVNRVTETGTQQTQQPIIAVPVDEVTKKQMSESSKVETGTI